MASVRTQVKGNPLWGGEIQIPFLYKPRAYQVPLFQQIQKGCKRIGLVWHRRAGKDKSCWNLVISEACKIMGTYYYIFPQQNQGRKVLWEGRGKDGVKFLDHLPSTLISNINNTDMKITLWNGSIIQVVGSDNVHSLRGTNPIGIVYSEFSFADPMAWNVFRPVVNENGGWVVFEFTPNSRNHAFDLYESTKDNPRWFWSILTVLQTKREDGSPVITEADIAEERASGMDEDFINQEYYCSFNGVMVGSYYGGLIIEAEKEDRIGNFVYDRQHPVYTAWDIGVSDSTAIWFYQKIQRKIIFIDYYENVGEGIDHYIKHLQSQKYIYRKNYLPHDIKKRDFTTGKSAYDYAYKLTGKRDYLTVVPKGDIGIGIDNVRLLLPRCYFDKNKCKRGIDALKQYHKVWNQKTRSFHNTPKHDWSSHGADAFRTFAMSYEEVPEQKSIKFWSHPSIGSDIGWMGG